MTALASPCRYGRAAALTVALLALAGPARAITPRDEVLRLVPPDVSFCLVVQDLRGHSEAVLASPFARKLADSSFGKRLVAAPEWQKLAEVNAQLRQNLGITWTELRDDILGDVIVAAYRAGPADKPQDEEGLFLLRARDARRLGELIDRLNDGQQKSGDVTELEPRKHNGQTYYHRVEKKGENYYYLRGPVLVFATRESILRQAIDLDQAAVAGEPPVARELRRLGADKDLAALWINPRAFEAELQRKAEAARGGDARVLKSLRAYWKAVDGVVFTAAVHQDDVEFGLTLGVKEDQLLPGGRRFFAGAVKPSRLWDRFPDNALFAVAGQVDVVGLVDMVGEFLPEDARKGIRDAVNLQAGPLFLGKDIAKEVLPNLGPDWGLCVLAPPAKDKDWFPHVLGALRIQPGATKPPVDQAVLNALNSLTGFAVAGYNKEHPDSPTELKYTEQDSVPVRYFINDKQFPPGLQPAYALKDGYLVLASCPEAIRRFTANAATLPPGGEVPLLRLSLRDWRRYVTERQEPLAAYSAERNGIPRAEATRRLNNLIDGLEFFDRVELSQRLARPGQIKLALRVRTMLPLR
jgi:hypothetical protein